MTTAAIRAGLVLSCNPHVAGMLDHLGTWIKPECWQGWVEENGLSELCRLEVVSIDSDSLNALASSLRLAFANLN